MKPYYDTGISWLPTCRDFWPSKEDTSLPSGSMGSSISYTIVKIHRITSKLTKHAGNTRGHLVLNGVSSKDRFCAFLQRILIMLNKCLSPIFQDFNQSIHKEEGSPQQSNDLLSFRLLEEQEYYQKKQNSVSVPNHPLLREE